MTEGHQVTIFNKTYVLKSTADEALTDRICQRLDREMHRIAAEHPRLGYQQVLLLAALNHLEALEGAEAQLQSLADMIDDGGFDPIDTDL